MSVRSIFLLIFFMFTGLLGSLLYVSYLSAQNQKKLAASEIRRFESYKLADQLRQSSDDLTRLARTYVVTGDPVYEQYFCDVLAIRDGEKPRPENYERIYWDFVVATRKKPTPDAKPVSLQNLMREMNFTAEEFAKLDESRARSDALVRLEEKAMNAVKGKFDDGSGNFTIVKEPDPEMARQIMHGEEYHRAKSAIMEPINEFLTLLDARTAREVQDLRQKGHIHAGLMLSLAVVGLALTLGAFLGLHWRVIIPVRKLVAAAEQVGAAEYGKRVEHASSDELGELASAFNHMTSAIQRDIREREKNETALAEAEERSRLLLESTRDGIFGVDTGGLVTFVNASAAEMLAFRREEIIGKSVHSLVHHSRKDGSPYPLEQCPMLRSYTEGTASTVDDEVLWRKDGLSFDTEYTSEPIRQDDAIIGAVVVFRDISQRKQAQAELHKLSSAVEQSPSSVIITDVHGRIEYVNPKFTQITGYTREEVIGKNPRILKSGVQPPEFYEDLWKTISSGRDWHGEFCNRKKNGDIYWELASISPVHDTDDQVAYFVAVKEDITERRAAEEKFRLLFEQSSDAHLIFDESGIIDCNNAAVVMLRCQDKEELLSKHPAEFSPEFQPDGRLSDEKSVEMDRIAREKGYHRFDWTHRKMDGEEFPVEVTLTPVVLEGRPALLVVWHDLTERKRMEEEINRVNFLSDIALEQTHCGYWHVDYSDPDYYYQSERAARILGEPLKPNGRYHLQHEWFDRLVEANPETAEKTAERYQGTIDGRYENYESTYAYKRPVDGEIVWVHALGKVVRDDDGKILHMYGVYQDITARVEAEKSLKDAKERLTHELAVARELSDAADREHQLWLQGESIAARALRESIEVHAGSDDPVLLTGPNGSGQEAVARAIHRNSPRAGRPFIYVACPHVSAADDTAFGFRAANSGQPSAGKMSLADGGTLYLEGIEALSISAQQNLMKALRDAADHRAAGQQPEPDVRFITCAANDLTDAARQGDFDGELARVLGTRRLAVPSLAERRDDVILLANNIVADRARSLGKALDGLSPESEERLLGYSWPGNLGELQSVVERAVVLAKGTSVDIPEDLLREGRRVGGYTLERQLGAGGMGEVWLARHALLARPSAVKLIRQESLQAESKAREMLEQRFLREAQATSQLRSPHTVELYDFGVTEDGDFYYVMEYLNGVDLDSLVTTFGPVDPARAVFFLRQACMSLCEAHGAGLVHRDVKPANLFACRLGPHYDFLKLLDFGIVKTTSAVGQTVTVAGQLKGTPTILSPEVVQGGEAGFESDIYALGCVAYWLLSGKHVFEGASIMKTLVQHVSQPPKPLSEHRSDLPSELNELVLCCLAKNPADRPSSAFELGERFASVPLVDSWDQRRAEAWWTANMPDIDQAGSTASPAETEFWDSDDTG